MAGTVLRTELGVRSLEARAFGFCLKLTFAPSGMGGLTVLRTDDFKRTLQKLVTSHLDCLAISPNDNDSFNLTSSRNLRHLCALDEFSTSFRACRVAPHYIWDWHTQNPPQLILIT